jgi:hypothetical protein
MSDPKEEGYSPLERDLSATSEEDLDLGAEAADSVRGGLRDEGPEEKR